MGTINTFFTIVCTSRCSFQVSEDEDFIDIQWRKLLYPTCWVDIEFWLDDEKVKYLKSQGFQSFATLKTTFVKYNVNVTFYHLYCRKTQC